MPPLGPNQVIVPDTMNLMFQFKNSNTKSHFKNNLGMLLCEGLKVRVGGEIVYDNTGESLFEIYKDLCKPEQKRESMLENRIANQNVRKMLSKDESALT